MKYKDYLRLYSLLLDEYKISTYELNLIDDVLSFFDAYVEDDYDEDDVIEHILNQHYLPNTEENFSIYREILKEMGLKEWGDENEENCKILQSEVD